MKDYKEILAYQPVVTATVVGIVDSLAEGTMTKEMFHNRKSYCKKKKDLGRLLEYSIAFEIATLEGLI